MHIVNWLLIGLYITPTFAQLPTPARGKIIRFENFPSKYVDTRNVDIWLPEKYTPIQKYPVLYMHDGQMLFDSTITWNRQEWRVDETLQELFDQNQVEPFIVVGIWNNGVYRNSEYIPSKVVEMLPDSIRSEFIENEMLNKTVSDEYLNFIVHELKPRIDSVFSTLTSAAHTFIAGSSKGGLISLYAVCEYPEIFSRAACLSTHWIGSTKIGTEIFPYAVKRYLESHLPAPGERKFYFDYGTLNLDRYYKPYQELIDQLFIQRGFTSDTFRSTEFPGSDHTEESWAQRFKIPILFLLNGE